MRSSAWRCVGGLCRWIPPAIVTISEAQGLAVVEVVDPSAACCCSAPFSTTVISGYSSLTPASHSNTGQHSGNGAVLLVFSDNLHLGLGFGYGPQSSTSSSRRSLPSLCTHEERPQNGDSSHVCPGSTVAHLVEAKHSPGKSAKTNHASEVFGTIFVLFISFYPE